MSDLIRMTHPDRDFHSDVHPDEVENYRQGGWNVDTSEPEQAPVKDPEPTATADQDPEPADPQPEKPVEMAVPQLKEALKAKGIEFPADAKKADLQALLAASEEGGAE